MKLRYGSNMESEMFCIRLFVLNIYVRVGFGKGEKGGCFEPI